jgi:hypothetical protein
VMGIRRGLMRGKPGGSDVGYRYGYWYSPIQVSSRDRQTACETGFDGVEGSGGTTKSSLTSRERADAIGR